MMIRERRQALGLTIEELANLAGVTSVTVSNIELGKVTPNKSTMKLVEMALEEKENEDRKAQ